MKILWTCVLVAFTVSARCQAVPEIGNGPEKHVSVSDFGLVYPLSTDWVRATDLLRKRAESTVPAPNYDILLAAVYVPKSNLSPNSPFFSLRAYRQPSTDCKRNLEAMIAQWQEKKDRPDSGVQEFSAAGRDYFRVNFAPGAGRRHQCVICTASNGHLLVWNAAAPNEKGLDAILSTLNSITALSSRNTFEPAPRTADQKSVTGAGEQSTQPLIAKPERVRVSSGMTTGLLIKKIAPTYPADAREAHIQGTVVLRAEINKEGDITDLELEDGPIELAGSAVAAVRQWKYRPYLLKGEPVIVETQIQINYQLR